MVPQTIDSPSSVARRRDFVATPVRLDAAPVAFSPELASPREGGGSRFLRFVLPWIVAFVLWSLVACSPAPSIVALDGETGAIRWRKENVGRVAGAFANRVFIETADAFVGLDAGSGKEVWRISRESGARLVEPFVPEGDVYVLESAGVVKRFDGASGANRGEVAISIPVGEVRRLAFSGRVAYVQAHDGTLYRCDEPTATAHLLARTHGAIGPVVSANALFAVLSDGSLAAFDLRTGVEGWHIAGLPAAFSLEFRNQVLWLGGVQGALLAIEPDSGRIRFALPDAGTDARVFGADSRPSSVVLLRNGRGLAFVDPVSGAVTRSIPVTDRIATAVSLTRSVLIRRASDGAVLGYDPDSGERLFLSETGPHRDVAIVLLDPRAPHVSLLTE